MKRATSNQNMKKNLVILTLLGCLLSAVSCSDGYDEPANPESGPKTTREATDESTEGDTDEDPTIIPETGASPIVAFYSVDEEDCVEVNPGESQTAQAPLDIELNANISNPDSYNYLCEWRIWRTSENGSENTPLVTRYEENTHYTLTRSGGYGIKLYVTFSLDGDTIEYESDPISVVISESKLICPDGFSPNNDGINDTLRITAQSIVKLDAQFFNRWGEKIHSVTLATAQRAEDDPHKLILWDGRVNGNIISDGVYLLHLDALGSDGIKYKIKKTISVLTGYRENEGNGDSGGGSSQ